MSDRLDEEDRILAAIRRIVRAIDLHSRYLVTRVGLTGPQLATLRVVRSLGEASPSSVARALKLSQPTVSGIVDRLCQRGLLGRSPDARDRRRVVLRSTSAGKAALDAAPSLLQERFRAELARLEDWERSMMLATLQRIAAMMDAEQLDASPVLITGVTPAQSENEARPPREADEEGEEPASDVE